MARAGQGPLRAKDADERRRESAEIRASLEAAGAFAGGAAAEALYDVPAAGFVEHGHLSRLVVRLPGGRKARVTLTPRAGVASGVVVVARRGEDAPPPRR